ncbi:MAG TPA: ROK family protein [Micromonosporaceae bacterium]|jgi:glucokinase
MGSVVIAVDVGGTVTKGALVDPSGMVVHAQRRPTEAARGPDAVRETIVGTALDLAAIARARDLTPVACGVVVPAVIDEDTGIVVFSANLGLRDVPLRDEVARRTGLPTLLGHDVRAAATAEARSGAGTGVRRMLFLALGTGIAAAFALDGTVDPGAHGASGEIGHVAIRSGPHALPCACGGHGCLERYASASAVAAAYATEPSPAGAASSTVDAQEVLRRALAGEQHAAGVWADTVAALADGLLIGIAVHDPQLVVLGGGLAQAGDHLLVPLAKQLTRRRTFHQLPDLAVARFGDEAGCYGAALLARDALARDAGAALSGPA